MKLDEIVITPSRAGDLYKYQQYHSLNKTPAFDDLSFAEAFPDSDEHVLVLINSDNDVVSVLDLTIRDNSDPVWQIKYTETDSGYQNRGCFRYLLIRAVNQHKEVMSDDHQTPEAVRAWKGLIQYPGGQMEIWVVDGDTRTPTYGVPTEQIWNDKETPILLVTNRLVGSSVVVNESRERSMKKSGLDFRMEINMWFGIASQSDGFCNP